MKNFYVVLLLSISSFPAFAGGVSGGGGNTKPLHPITDYHALSVIAEARLMASAYFTRIQDNASYWRGQEAVERKLFGGPDTVVDLISKVTITVERKKSCIDEKGKPHDGSAQGGAKAFVCLSVPRLVKKLSAENVDSQIFGLAIHEYSHLAGTTEAEADSIQENAVRYFIFNANLQTIREQNLTFKEYFQRRITELTRERDVGGSERDFWSQVRNFSDSTLADYLQNVSPEPFSSIDLGSLMELSIWPEKLRPHLNMTYLRLRMLQLGACAQFSYQPEEKRECQTNVDDTFRGRAEVDFAELIGHKPGDVAELPEEFLGRKYGRLADRESAKAEFGRLADELKVYQDFMVNLKMPATGQ